MIIAIVIHTPETYTNDYNKTIETGKGKEMGNTLYFDYDYSILLVK